MPGLTSTLSSALTLHFQQKTGTGPVCISR
jgi:hypothetical protein